MNDSLNCAADARLWFEAPVGDDTARVAITGHARHAADAAVALYRLDPILQAIEDWAGFAFDWRWTDAPFEQMQDVAHRALASDALSEQCLFLDLPPGLESALGAPAEALARQLCRPSLAGVVVASQFRLTADDAAMLEPGGAVVLSESMSPTWRGLLRGAGEVARFGHGWPIVIQSPDDVRRIAPDAQARKQVSGNSGNADGATHGDSWYEVRLNSDALLPARCFEDWFAGPLRGIGMESCLWHCTEQAAQSGPVGSGELAPWAGGWAFLIQDM